MQTAGRKQRYLYLDGLRGVAALLVLLYHLFEAVAFAAGAPEQKMFHGFLAVDFFLVLSGFVMGYAYDDQWEHMSIGKFFRKRLIRLHPMVVIGVVTGLVMFIAQGCFKWDGTHVAWWQLLVGTLLALFLLPAPTGLDVRGNTEMFPLNGPHWSLFFEYIGNILYALLLRKLPTRILKIWVGIAGCALIAKGILGGDCNIAYGWSSEPSNAFGGLLRMLFDYPMGLLLARMFREKQPSHAKGPVFLICSLALIALLSVPGLSAYGNVRVWYEVICIAIAFPAIIWFGARGASESKAVNGVVNYLGQLSYPLYAIHYPFIYMYIGWINKGLNPFGPYMWCTPVAVTVICIALATLLLYIYDMPVRKALAAKFMTKQ